MLRIALSGAMISTKSKRHFTVRGVKSILIFALEIVGVVFGCGGKRALPFIRDAVICGESQNFFEQFYALTGQNRTA
ncbi:hypothetical protein [Collimonas sp. OK242]|jgi:hypothetical protein|uniref:hypothetical protein n=1 Tax=Collimonas sp. OK242 TaxID=1798195 RepID=UPI000B8471BB|nr:hypothetical protein [Collimonas sp. OK242]